ncbi:MAG TPA: HEAT repeat domain-containing protein [Gemmatimonadaceae bacterium]|nr:HEAT repeat domain-containing protein [Gemmatimonadaceae bacterium]
MSATAAQVAEHDDDAPETPFPPAPIIEMLKLFTKGVRAHQLYMHNNPTYLKALELLRHGFAPVWEHTDTITLTITESTLVWEGVTVLDESSKSSESLAWTFYKDGVRELRFEKGFEESDLVAFLDVIQRARRNSEDDDLLVMLWENDLAHLRYRYIDAGNDAAGVPDFSSETPEPRVIEPPGPDDAPTPDESLLQSRPGTVSLEDFDSTLYFLDQHEVEYLKGAVEAEYASDLRANVLAMLLDIFELQADGAVRTEIGEILDGLMLLLLSAAQFRSVAYLIKETRDAAERTKGLEPAHRALLAKIPDRLSDPQALAQVLQSLDEGHELPPQEDLNALFDELRPSSLGTIFDWIGRVNNPAMRTLLQTAGSRLAAANTAELMKLIGHSDRVIAVEAIRRAGAMKSAAAVAPLGKRTSDRDPGTRLAAVQALADIGSAGALQWLERAVEDEDRDVRVAVARALTARAYRPALPKIESIVKGKAIRDADLTERMAMFEAFGALSGDAGVPLLDKMLNERTFLGKREEPELRACAAMALGRIGTDKATASLRKSVNEKDVIVRNAVSKALRGGNSQS